MSPWPAKQPDHATKSLINSLSSVFEAKLQLHNVPSNGRLRLFQISCTYLESEEHDEEAAGDGEDHVEEEVPVVAVADAAVEPGAVVVHLNCDALK